jgi:hypothetical protein
MVESTMELPRPLGEKDKGSQAINRLKREIASLTEKKVPFSDFLRRLKEYRGKRKQEDFETSSVLNQSQEFVMAELEEKKDEPLTVRNLPQIARKAVEVLSTDASPEVKERLAVINDKIAEFEAKGISGEVSEDPKEATRYLMATLAGKEGEQLYEAVAQAVGENPYPKPEEKKLPVGSKGWKGRGKYWGCLGGSIAILATCAVCGFTSTFMTRLQVNPEAQKKEEEAAYMADMTAIAESAITGSYSFSTITGMEQQGENGQKMADEILNQAALLIESGTYSLNDIEDPRFIARLVYNYQQEHQIIIPAFDIYTIEDHLKRDRVQQYLDELEKEGIVGRESSLVRGKREIEYPRPSLRQVAAARAQQKSISFRSTTTQAPPQSYQSRGGHFYSKGKTSSGRRV